MTTTKATCHATMFITNNVCLTPIAANKGNEQFLEGPNKLDKDKPIILGKGLGSAWLTSHLVNMLVIQYCLVTQGCVCLGNCESLGVQSMDVAGCAYMAVAS